MKEEWWDNDQYVELVNTDGETIFNGRWGTYPDDKRASLRVLQWWFLDWQQHHTDVLALVSANH